MKQFVLAVISTLWVVGCSEQEAAVPAKKYKPIDGKICSVNSTDDTLYFVLSESSNGKMRGKITPGSRFCTGSFANAKLTVSIEKRGTEYCDIQVKQGMLYSLTKLNTDGPCKWAQS